jgi:hypothetical protein
MNEGFLVGRLKTVSRIFFYAFVAVLPFQIKTLVFTQEFYGGGFFNPYLSHFLYLGDVFLMLSLLFFGLYLVFGKKKIRKIIEIDLRLLIIVGMFLVMYVFSILGSVNKFNSLFYALRFFEFFMIFLMMSGGFFNVRIILYVFLGSLAAITLIGMLQYVLQQSIGLKFLGEPVISADTLGVAKVSFFNREVLRVYGTFPHPNVFGGFLVFGIFFTIYYWQKYRQLFTALLILFGIGIILTFSRSAMLALIAGIVVYYSLVKIKISWKYFIFGALFLIFLIFALDLTPILSQRFIIGDANSIYERGLFYEAGKQMFFDNLDGVGAGNFTRVMQGYLVDKLMPWQFQPVHNIFVLIVDEIGIWGLGVFVYLFIYLLNSLLKLLKDNEHTEKSFPAILITLGMTILVIGMFDHYFISLYQGQALLWIFLGLVNVELTRKNLFL